MKRIHTNQHCIQTADLIWACLLLATCLASNCPLPCKCSDDQSLRVNCSHHLLIEPPKLSTSTLTLDLSYNALGPALNLTLSHLRNLTSIDLSHNALTSLHYCSFSGFLSLKSVQLSGNRLSSLPAALFSDASRVEVLDLSHNLLTDLPQDAVKNLPELKILNLAHNMIVGLKLGPRFQVSRHLQILDLSYNQIEALDSDSFEICRQWEASFPRTVNLAFNRISYIANGTLSNIPNLQDLNLSGNTGISAQVLRDTLKELEAAARNLDHLSLAHTNLVHLQPLFTHVTEMSLKSLNVSGNRISGIPNNTFSTIRSLRVLDLSRNSLVALPVGLSDLVNLQVLNVSHNSLSSFQGAAVSSLSNLRTLDISHNRLDNSSSLHLSPLVKLAVLNVNNNLLPSVRLPHNTSNLQHLNYKSNRLTEFPGLEDAAALITVDASDNDIRTLPGFLFRGAKYPRLVNFSHNNIETVDHRAFLPKSPLVIDFSNNYLKEIRYSNWVATQKLFLSRNEIIYIDSQAFHGMSSLEELDLSGNKISTLHEELFSSLTNMKTLNLSLNRLEKLPWLRLFQNLEQLENLDLSSNNITVLDDTMLLPLHNIHTLKLRSNQLRVIFPRLFRDVATLRAVDLSHNPFDCVCNMLSFQDWLRRTRVAVVGLYSLNSTAYMCRTPSSRKGQHLLEWKEGNFECNRYMLPLIIVGSVGMLCALLITASFTTYRFYHKWKIAEAHRRKLRKEAEERILRAKEMALIQLSNQEIGRAIQEALDRKRREKLRLAQAAAERSNGFVHRSTNTIPKHGVENKQNHGSKHKQRTVKNDKNVTTKNDLKKYEEVSNKQGPFADKSGKKVDKIANKGTPQVQPPQNSEPIQTSMRKSKYVRENNNYDRHEPPSRWQSRQHETAATSQHSGRYETAARFHHGRELERGPGRVSNREPRPMTSTRAPVDNRRGSALLTSSHNNLEDAWGSYDSWNVPPVPDSRFHRRTHSHDPRVSRRSGPSFEDSYASAPGRVTRLRDAFDDYVSNSREVFPPGRYYSSDDDDEPRHTHGFYHDDSDYGSQEQKHLRSRSYQVLPYTKPTSRRPRADSPGLGLGPRAVSQPYLATTSKTDWI